MNELKKAQLGLLGLLLGLLYGATTIQFSLSLQIYYLFCIAGIFILLSQSDRLPLTDHEKIGILIILIFCLISVLTFWINGMPGKGNIYVQGRHGKFLLAIPVYYFFRHFYIPTRLIWSLAIIIALGLFFIAVIDWSTNGVFGWPGRASGNTHPIYFGIQSLMMTVLILVFRSQWRKDRTTNLIAWVSISAAIAALIMTGSRSVWLAAPVVGALYLVSNTEKLQFKYAIKVCVLIIIASTLLYQLPPVKNRWNEAIQELQDYQISESVEDPVRISSLGARLEMWRAARLMIMDNPILGVGTGGYQVTATQYYNDGGWSKDITKRNGPHNQYLNSWASRGIFGLAITLLILGGPLVYCLQLRKNSKLEEVRALALACIMIIAVFAVSGLSEDTLEKKPLIILYLTTLTLLLGQIRHRSDP